MKAIELQQMFIDRYHKEGVYIEEFEALADIDNPHFARVLLSRHGWCMENGIYTATELLMFEPEILHHAGLALPEYSPVDFERTTAIGGLDWLPLNEGAALDELNGDLIDFDTANATEFEGSRMLSKIEWRLLAAAPNQFGLYKDTFGRVFQGADNNLFLPFSGCRAWDNGTQYFQGSNGYYWSSSVSNADGGYNCYFYSGGGVYPENNNLRAFGFSVRRVKKTAK